MDRLSPYQKIWQLLFILGMTVLFTTAVIIRPIRAQFAAPVVNGAFNPDEYRIDNNSQARPASSANTSRSSRAGATVFINELDADQVGTDAGEFIELYDGGVGNTSLDGLVLVAYNGANGLSYNLTPFTSIDLDGYSTNAEGYFTLGNAAVPGASIIFNNNTLQNGADAVALYLGDASDFPFGTPVTTTNLIDAIVYDTDDPDVPELLQLLNPGQPQVNENGGGNGTMHSNQRCPNGAGGLRNTETYRQHPPTPNGANNCLPDLYVSKTGPATISPGRSITYAISYGNVGVTGTTAVVLTDTLPPGVTYLSDNSGLPCPACAIGAAGDLTWNVAALPAGSSHSFNLIAAVSPAAPYGVTLTNTVTIASPDDDADPANNSDEWLTGVTPLDLAVNKSGPAAGISGETMVYTLTLQNSGIVIAANVILTDTLPPGLVYTADSAPWTAVVAGSTIVWNAGDIAADTLTTFNLTVTVDSGIANGAILTNTLAATTDTAGDELDNNTAVWPTAIYPIVPIATARAGNDGDVFAIEGQVIYTPGTYNLSGWGLQDDSGGIAVFYTPPPNVSLGDTVHLVATRGHFNNEEQLAAPVYHFANLGPGPEVAPIPFSTGAVAGGSSEGWLVVISGAVSGLLCPTPFNYEFTLDDGSGAALVFVDGDSGVNVCSGGLQNGMAAMVAGFSTQYDAVYEVKPRRPADVFFIQNTPQISKSAPVQVVSGALYTYSITVANPLDYTLTNLVITDAVPLPANFAYALDGGIFADGIVTWMAPSLAEGATLTVRFAVTAPEQTAVIQNVAYAIYAANYVTPTFGPLLETLVVSGPLSIHHIQGARHFSLLHGETVTGVQGVVTAVGNTGFFMQAPEPDNDDDTSEGIYVYLGNAPGITAGNLVSVTGVVEEYYPSGVSSGNLSVTEIRNATVTILADDHPLPAPVILGVGGRIPPNQIIDNDSPGDVNLTPNFDPEEDGIDFYESVEGMLVQVNDAIVVGSSYYNQVVVVGDNGAGGGIFSPRNALVVRQNDFNPERLIIDDTLVPGVPAVAVGDTFAGVITGVVDYSFGNFVILNPAPLPPLVPGGLQPEMSTLAGDANHLTVATFNVANLHANADPGKLEALATQIVQNMRAPDIIALQEVQDNNGAVNNGVVDAGETYDALLAAIIDSGGPLYDFRDIAPENNQDGGQSGGNIRVGFIFRPDRVAFVDRPGGTAVLTTTVSSGSTSAELSYSPGRVAPLHQAFTGSRKPLAAEFIFNGYKLILIANHFNSKVGDDPLFGRAQPPILHSEAQRLQQAQVVHDFVQQILDLDAPANVIVLGDLNDFPFSAPVQTLQHGILSNLINALPPAERYTYIFEGNAQVLDHILANESLGSYAAPTVDIVHLNAEFTLDGRPTDHDPVIARFTMPTLIAGFTSNSPVALGEISSFSNSSAAAVSYEWDFGDGLGASTAVNPSYTYTAVGVYTVVLTATNPLGKAVVTGTHLVVEPGFDIYLPVIMKPAAVSGPEKWPGRTLIWPALALLPGILTLARRRP